MQASTDEVLNKDHPFKGLWKKNFFKNQNPISLELACGKGEYSVGLGSKYPDSNFLGIDIKGARIWYGASEALDRKLQNVGFLRSRIDFITSFFLTKMKLTPCGLFIQIHSLSKIGQKKDLLLLCSLNDIDSS